MISNIEDSLKYELLWLKSNANLYNIDSKYIIDNKAIKDKIKNYLEENNIDCNFILKENISRIDNKQLYALYCQGNIDLLNSKYVISVIGTRHATPNGIKRTQRLVKELRMNINDICFMSGLAKGIDTCAMQTALECNAPFIGVIGTPLNKYYPLENKGFQIMLAKKQLLLSHVPFYKYSKQTIQEQRRFFLERNYVMSILSDATIITEAFENSGTFAQAKACIYNKRKLFVLNSCYEKNFNWVKQLDKLGAIRVKTINDVIDNL